MSLNLFTEYTLPPLVSALLFFVLGVFVLRKNKNKALAWSFFLICLATIWWQFCWFILFNVQSAQLASILVRVGYAGIIFISVFLFHFSLILLKDLKVIKTFDKFLLWLAYGLSAVFEFSLFFTNTFVQGYYVYFWGYYPRVGWMHLVYVALTLFLITRIVILLIKAYRKPTTSALQKSQMKYFVVAQIFYNLAAVDFLVNYGVEFYPFAFVFILVFLSITAYIIMTQRFMNVRPVLRNSTVYLSSLIIVLVPALVVKYWLDAVLPSFIYWIDFLAVVAMLSIFPYIRNCVNRFANKYLFSSLYDIKQVVAELSDKLGTTLDTAKIYEVITKILGGALHMKGLSFITISEVKSRYRVPYSHSFTWPKKLAKQPLYDFIFKDFVVKNKILSVDELKAAGSSKAKRLAKDLEKIKLELVVPLIVNDKPIGVMVLGKKESKDSYSHEDLELLRIIGAQTAIALENALLYEETKKFNAKLIKEVDKATHDLKQANQELKTLDHAKSDFISIASHQLRTPLTVIKGYSSMMLEGSFGPMPKPIRNHLRKVYDSNERLIDLVDDLLNISRIESGRLQFNFTSGQLDEMVKGVVEELKPSAAKKGLALKFIKPKTSLPPLKMDKTKLRQVVINLIDNAIKYTEKGWVKVSLRFDGPAIKFCVADSGIGIKDSTMPHLFKKFSRGEKTSIIYTEGSGLGLYVGKMMIEAHNGRIWAESKGEGKGSEFCFEIPISKQQTTNSK